METLNYQILREGNINIKFYYKDNPIKTDIKINIKI